MEEMHWQIVIWINRMTERFSLFLMKVVWCVFGAIAIAVLQWMLHGKLTVNVNSGFATKPKTNQKKVRRWRKKKSLATFQHVI